MTTNAQSFFFEHAGDATPPGREACAALLAAAEARADDAGITFRWEPDYDGDLGDHAMWCDEAEAGTCEHEIETCAAYNEDGDCLTSLSGIIDADANYRRVVEAELAQQALA